MDIEELHPDFRKAARRVPSLPFGSIRWQPVLQRPFPLFNRTKIVDGVSAEDQTIGPVRLRIYRPDTEISGAAMLWIHGGGMVVGTERQDNRTCSTYARELGLVVVSVGYRLAPQHPFPAANDDCFAAWQWLVDHAAELGVDPGRLIVAGESGGGGHAASLVQRIRDQHAVQPMAQVLLVPMLDDRTAADRDLDRGYFVWRWSDTRGGWTAYLGHEPGQRSEPGYAVPARRDDLQGLPPTWIGCGDKDLFYEEDRRYADRLRDAGVAVEFHDVAGGPHGFHVLVPESPVTEAFFASSREFIRSVDTVKR